MREQPRCLSCYRTLLPLTGRLWCVACRREYPLPAEGKVVLASAVVYEQAETPPRVLKEEVTRGQTQQS